MTYLKKLEKVVSLTNSLFNLSDSQFSEVIIGDNDPIDEGGFGFIYLISPKVILKEYKCESIKQSMLFAADEIISSLDFKYGLIPLSVVRLKENHHFALTKKYIHWNIPTDRFNSLPISVLAEFDTALQQYKVDAKDKIYRVDTQSPLAGLISWKSNEYTDNIDEDIKSHLESRLISLKYLLKKIKKENPDED